MTTITQVLIDSYTSSHPGNVIPKDMIETSIPKFQKYLTDPAILSNFNKALMIVEDPEGTLKYFCKLCWLDIYKIREVYPIVNLALFNSRNR